MRSTIKQAIRTELSRQWEEERDGPYTYNDFGGPTVGIDGYIDLDKLAEAIEKALSVTPDEALLTVDEKKEQGKRCGCLGTDDYCTCQNVRLSR